MITVLFSCNACGLKDHSVQVPARETADVDVVEWMLTKVMVSIADEHLRMSPRCKSTRARDIKIPCPDNSEFVGQQIE